MITQLPEEHFLNSFEPLLPDEEAALENQPTNIICPACLEVDTHANSFLYHRGGLFRCPHPDCKESYSSAEDVLHKLADVAMDYAMLCDDSVMLCEKLADAAAMIKKVRAAVKEDHA